ncbi:MAG: SDR family oxidoreductase [Myxococcales bacterium]|nr:SDR family oxidoreductase [Myxococcales bacterium]MCB9520258.1 SDR family oxidoreductase [Myxococcales bacterium]MCB9531374.1 SDR family oxidoreductase [Myxococcales bacterium]MCB9533553.1 SDR family oxidoreductase [Myxococcales bacterium]
MSFSVAETLAGREVVLTGATGFVGKVVLVALLTKPPQIGAIHLVLRAKGGASPLARLEQLVATSPAFLPLHEQHGDGLGAWLRDRVFVHDGDLGRPLLGLDPCDVAALRGRVALVLNCAALVDFEPDVRLAVESNIAGPLNAAALARELGARLLHVSTCFVAGRRDGRIAEAPHERLPNGAALDAEGELADLERAMAELAAFHRSAELDRELVDAARLQRHARGQADDEAAVARAAARAKESRITDDWKQLGVRRADERGWPNTYTYSKGIGEALLRARFADVPTAVFRPAVVESAASFPFPGWNEGFNTCGPLAYLIGTWFKALPGRPQNPFDVVPVDHVVFGLLVAAAAVIRGEHRPVYQAASSERNRLTLGRANELTVLGQRAWLREHGESFVDRFVRSRADTTLFDDTHPLSVDSVDALLARTADALRALPERSPDEWKRSAKKRALELDRTRRSLRRVALMVDAFVPFTRDLRQSFIADALSSHDVEEAELAWRPESIDWRRYWLEVHLPGMRRWCFPLIDGDEAPTLDPPRPVQLGADEAASQAAQRVGA